MGDATVRAGGCAVNEEERLSIVEKRIANQALSAI